MWVGSVCGTPSWVFLSVVKIGRSCLYFFFGPHGPDQIGSDRVVHIWMWKWRIGGLGEGVCLKTSNLSNNITQSN